MVMGVVTWRWRVFVDNEIRRKREVVLRCKQVQREVR